jgi:sulfite reductase (ferredoxin)
MQSFRSELEDLNNPIVENDILELGRKISDFKDGNLDEEKFRSLRLARGVYGQRQPGVQMIRIKIPYGKMTTKQLRRLCIVSDEYSKGRLHTTTRQCIQIHYVSLDRTPELWAELEKDQITIREACGNAVRNVTASIDAGINPDEAFDVSPYAHNIFEYFLRQPFGQELGRKFKISVSGAENDNAFSFMHDVGLIAKIKDGVKGFKVMVGGGLGAQPKLAQCAYEFIPTNEVIPFIEVCVRLFDRFGERANRSKARLKYLVAAWGIEGLKERIEEIKLSLTHQTYEMTEDVPVAYSAPNENYKVAPEVDVKDKEAYDLWYKTNVKEQKQDNFKSVYIRLTSGDFYTDEARILADLVDGFAGDDIRIGINQGLQLRYVREKDLPYVYSVLESINMVKSGFDSTLDVTSCPGTTTCNLGISDSTHTAIELEKFMAEKHPELVFNDEIKIKISGCMNSCGQHSLAQIGFHGSSMKEKATQKVMPALQVLLGGGVTKDGGGRISDKIIKIPSRRVLSCLDMILNEYKTNKNDGEGFNAFYDRTGKMHFHKLLRPLMDLTNIKDEEFVDWGNSKAYEKAIGTGECAGVVIDLVATLLMDVEEKMSLAQDALDQHLYPDSIHHSYASMVNGAKALLTGYGVRNNALSKVIKDFDETAVKSGDIDLGGSFSDLVFQIDKNIPSKDFAIKFLKDAKDFYDKLILLRQKQLASSES